MYNLRAVVKFAEVSDMVSLMGPQNPPDKPVPQLDRSI